MYVVFPSRGQETASRGWPRDECRIRIRGGCLGGRHCPEEGEGPRAVAEVLDLEEPKSERRGPGRAGRCLAPREERGGRALPLSAQQLVRAPHSPGQVFAASEHSHYGLALSVLFRFGFLHALFRPFALALFRNCLASVAVWFSSESVERDSLDSKRKGGAHTATPLVGTMSPLTNSCWSLCRFERRERLDS